MIIKFKIFESINSRELKIGDYVICEEKDVDINISNITNNRIGKLVFETTRENIDAPFIIEFDLSKKEIEELVEYLVTRTGKGSSKKIGDMKYRRMKRSEIKYWSENKEELEQTLEDIITAKKYNL